MFFRKLNVGASVAVKFVKARVVIPGKLAVASATGIQEIQINLDTGWSLS